MAASGWKLTVTFLGAQQSPREVVAQGENWLTALREGRRQLGEEPILPPGASCVVAPNGEVTLLDGTQRRRYVVSRCGSEAPPSSEARTAVETRPTSDPRPDSDRHREGRPVFHRDTGRGARLDSGGDLGEESRRAGVRAGETGPDSDVNRHADRAGGGERDREAPRAGAGVDAETDADSGDGDGAGNGDGRPRGLGLAVAPTMPVPAPPRPERTAAPPTTTPASGNAPAHPTRAKKATDYSPERAQALRREYEAALARAIVPPAAKQPGGSPAPDGLAGATTAAARHSSLPPPALALQRPAAGSPAESRVPRALGSSSLYGVRADGLALLKARDLEATPQSPLTYRERAYVISGRADRVRLEVLLQAELACIRRELAGHPRGQFVRLGVFAESFDETPKDPPVATLEWKDWRGRAVFALAETSAEWEGARGGGSAPTASNSGAGPTASNSEAGPAASGSATPPPPQAATAPASPAESTAAPSLVPAATQNSPPPAEERHSEPGSELDNRLASAFEAVPELYLLPTPLSGLEFTVQLLTRLVPCDAISACLYDIDTNEFRFVALSGLGGLDRKASAVAATAGLFGAARGAPLLIDDPTGDPRYLPAVDGRPSLEVSNLCYVPVSHRGRLLGMLQLINRSSRRSFDHADAAVLSYVAEQLGEFLANCRALID